MEVMVLRAGEVLLYKTDFIPKRDEVKDLIFAAHQACMSGSLDPMEKAIVSLSESFGHTNSLRLLKEYPFSREWMAMARVVQNDKLGGAMVFCKGAPENIFRLCGMTETVMQANTEVVHQLALKGLRVLAVAKAPVLQGDDSFPSGLEGFGFSLVGLVGLADPIRPEVPQAVQDCLTAGIKVMMITGDYPGTAKSIAAQIGLPSDGKIITGSEMAALSDDELKKQITSASVFARVLPEQKLRIVNALKSNGEVVAMTGDGVNDAPALKAAHIGVAMGNKGTDVSREAAAIVLLDDNFASIVMAMRQGRKIFDNLQKAMAYILAIHIPIIGLALLPAFMPSLPIFLLPLHIVFLELIIDPVCSIAFESEGEELGIMDRPPRPTHIRFFGSGQILLSVFQGLLLLMMVIGVYWLSIAEGHTEGEVRAIAFSALIIGNIFLVLTNLSKTRSFWFVLTEKNPAVKLILGGAVLVLLVTLYVPTLRSIFAFEFPGYQHFVSSVLGALVVLLILELPKYKKPKNTHFL